MIRRVTVRSFKRFGEQTFDLNESVVLAGPNNAGKSTLLQAIATWKFGLDYWVDRRQSVKSAASRKTGVAVTRGDFTAIPLREMNLLWSNRRVSDGPGRPRKIEIEVEGKSGEHDWKCGIEFEYANREMFYVRPLGAKNLDVEEIRNFPPKEAEKLEVVHIPPFSGIERQEARRDRGMQDMLVGMGRPGEILRNLLLEVDEGSEGDWEELSEQVKSLFGLEILKPVYSPAQPYILSEYRESGRPRPMDLANTGSGSLQVLLLFAFLFARPASVILLDEPDAHQHVILQRQVYDSIRKVARKRGGQIIVATHSEVLLDNTDPQRVLSFIGDYPRLLAHKTERNSLREALKRVTTTELLQGKEVGGVLYVEGETDERILAEWARVLDHKAQSFFERPFVHRLGGRKLAEAQGHLFALRAAFPEVRGVCLLDGDNREELDIEIKRSGLKILRWSRYEIENYLLIPDAIKRFMRFPLKEHLVEEEFGKQVPTGTDLFGDHVSLVRIKASEEFLLPLLASASEPTDKRSLHLIAAEMRADEIHPEVIEKLDAIAEVLVRP